MIKYSQGLPPLGRAAIGVGTATFGTLAIKTALDLGDRAIEDNVVTNSTPPSPIDNPFNNSLIESGANLSSLEVFLNSQHTFNVLAIFLIAFLIYILCFRFISHKNMGIIQKILPVKYSEKLKKYVTKGDEYNKKFLLVCFILNFITLLIVLGGNIYISTELTNHIQAYVIDYNNTHGINTSIFIFTISLFSSKDKLETKKGIKSIKFKI